jgi:tRNA pseudouridine38-40 synthase
MGRARFTVAYDGALFHGFAPNPGVATVASTLARSLERVLGAPVELTGAGRTDAGVHGWGQVVSFDLADGVDLDDLAHRVNRMCSPGVVVRAAAWAADDFDARFSAEWRHYRYHVLNNPVAHPLLTAAAWHVPQPLDLVAMQLGCDPLVGEHDFSSFCRRPKQPPGEEPLSLVRRVILARWSEVDEAVELFGVPLLRFEVRANAFCHQMVRSFVGTLVDVGLGKIPAGDVRAILLAKDRAAAGQVAPPHGLTLWEVGYSNERGGD